MAFMNQAKKRLIADALKKVVPKDWKYSLAVRHHSTIVMTIRAAPVNFIQLEAERLRAELRQGQTYLDPNCIAAYISDLEHGEVECLQLNGYQVSPHFPSEISEILAKIVTALNTGNHDNSDLMTDYFDIGHYITLQVGEYGKPFRYIPPEAAAA